MSLQSIGNPLSHSIVAATPPAQALDANAGASVPMRIAALQAEIREVRAELEQMRTERALLLERQRRVMDLIGAKNPEHLVHDLRNVLNERELLRALTEDQLK